MTKPNKHLVQRIEEFMSQLPHDEFLKQCLYVYTKTHDIVAEHRRLRNQSVLLGKCLKARFGGGGGNPARQLLDAGMIDRWESEYIWALVDVYQALFNLIQIAWEDIKAELSFLSDDCPNSETDLLFKILGEHYDVKFKKCINGYTLTVTNVETAAKLTRSAVWKKQFDPNWLGEVEFSDKERLDAGLKERSKQFVWFPLILPICRESAKRDSSVKEQLRKLYQELSYFADKWAKAIHKSRHEQDPLQRFHSVRWENQILHIGCRGGGYRSFTELYTHLPELSSSIPNND